MSIPVTAKSLIAALKGQLSVEPELVVRIEKDGKFYEIRMIPLRYTPDGIAVVTLRATVEVDD